MRSPDELRWHSRNMEDKIARYNEGQTMANSCTILMVSLWIKGRSGNYMFFMFFSWMAFTPVWLERSLIGHKFPCLLQVVSVTTKQPIRKCHLSPSFWELLMSSLVPFFLYLTFFFFFFAFFASHPVHVAPLTTKRSN